MGQYSKKGIDNVPFYLIADLKLKIYISVVTKLFLLTKNKK